MSKIKNDIIEILKKHSIEPETHSIGCDIIYEDDFEKVANYILNSFQLIPSFVRGRTGGEIESCQNSECAFEKERFGKCSCEGEELKTNKQLKDIIDNSKPESDEFKDYNEDISISRLELPKRPEHCTMRFEGEMAKGIIGFYNHYGINRSKYIELEGNKWFLDFTSLKTWKEKGNTIVEITAMKSILFN